MITRSAVAEVIRKRGLRVGRDFLDSLDKSVEYLVAESIKRAVWNRRKTVRAADLAYPTGDLGQTEVEPKVQTEHKPEPLNPVIAKEVNIGRSGGILRIRGT